MGDPQPSYYEQETCKKKLKGQQKRRLKHSMKDHTKGKGRRIRGTWLLYEEPAPGFLEAGRELQPSSNVLKKG